MYDLGKRSNTTFCLTQDCKNLRFANLLVFIKNLLDHNAEKILLLNPINSGGITKSSVAGQLFHRRRRNLKQNTGFS